MPRLAQSLTETLRAGKQPYRHTDFQKYVHLVPETVSVFMGGGRGGAKSECAAQIAAYHCDNYRDEASVLVLRKGPLKSLRSTTAALRRQFNRLWGRGTHKLNMSTYVWTLPTGGHFELGILPDDMHGLKYYEEAYQGNNFNLIVIDEGQAWARPDVLDLLLSNMRHAWIPCRLVVLANPGGLGHQWLAQRFVQGREPWRVYRIEHEREHEGEILKSSMDWMSCPSTYLDNPHNGPDYLTKLAASTGDEELLKAWITGSWDISRGAFFAGVLGNPHIKVYWPDRDDWGERDHRWLVGDWKFWLAMDHGTAAPLVCYVMAGSPGADGPDGAYYPAGSVILVDEYACHRPSDLSKAFGWTIPQLCVPIKALAKKWRIPAKGVADDAIFGFMGHEHGTINDEYAREGVVWRKSRKGKRAPRFEVMKRMLASAGKREEPGLYISRRCAYWWETVPFLIHDPRKPDEVLKCDTDHGLDTTTYGIEGYSVGAGVLRNLE